MVAEPRHRVGLFGGLNITQGQQNTAALILRWRDGHADARDTLLAQIYPSLRQIAAARLARETNASLATGDLINDAIVRIIETHQLDLRDRAHLIALASRIMRNLLVDRARAKETDKRRHQRVELCTRVDGEQRFDVKSLDSALLRLAAIEPALVELIEMRYFGGMTITDVAHVTGWSEPTVKRKWQTARAWLTEALLNPIELS